MILRLLCSILVAWGLSAFALKKTEGFAIAKLGEVFIEGCDDPIDPSLLSQPFTYLGKGGQSYVFVSEDGSIVIKFLRGSKLCQIQMRSLILSAKEKGRKILETETKLRQTLHSYAIARDLFKEESGILATHLSSSSTIATPLILIDRSNIKHMIDPNRYPFIIQKKASLVKEAITQLMQRGEVEAAKKALRSLFSLLKLRIDKGMGDDDPNLTKNFGFVDLSPIQIDGGSFELGPAAIPLIQNSQVDLQHWINEFYPELSDDFKSAYEDFLTQVL